MTQVSLSMTSRAARRLLLAGSAIVAGLITVAAGVAAAQTGSATPKLADAEIAAVVVAANAADVENGKLALARASDPAVKQFAQTMITDHTAVNARASELVEKLGVTPQPSDASRGLVASTDAAREELRKLQGSAFDRAYVKNEVAYHETVLATLDETLIPSAQNAELEALLTAVRPAFVAHLEHAKQLQATLEG